jgi:four helix bundle protein
MNTTTTGRSSDSPFRSRFDALEVGYELIRALRPIVAKLEKRDPDEAKQLRRAASSITRNLAEGNRRQGRDRRHLFNVAFGSLDEVYSSVRNGLAWGHLDDDEVTAALALVDRERAILRGLTR